MQPEFEKIYLSWRKGSGMGRHIVGKLWANSDGKYCFQYTPEGVRAAQQEGFIPYTEFREIDKVYDDNVLDIFAQRLMKSRRPDVQQFYDFWEIEPNKVNDKAYMLAHTQGLLPSDNFEFLADYNPVPGLHFLTEIASLSIKKLPAGTLKEGDLLSYKKDISNEHDERAIVVLKDGTEIGYIKKIHCHVFHKAGCDRLKLEVKAIEQNGTIRRAFLKVYYSE